jgi:hypothetical protein
MTTSIRDRERDRTRSPFVRAATRVLPLAAAVASLCAAALPAQAAEPWGFEQVTPVNKGAGSVHPQDTFQTSPDGNGFLLSATSSFDGVAAESVPLYTRYFASRGADGWSNRAMDPPTNHAGTSVVMSLLLASSDASHVLVASTMALAPGATPDGGNLYVRSTATGAYTLVATHEDIDFTDQLFTNQGNINAKYLANDGRSALFLTNVPLVPGAPDGRGVPNVQALYSWTAEEGLRVETVFPDSEGGGMVLYPMSAVGGELDNGIRNAVPDSGGLDRVYFSSGRESNHPLGDTGPVYVRSGGETKVVSVSRIPGASSDPVAGKVLATGRGGRFMFFKTHEASSSPTPLTSDTPTDVGAQYFLYRYDAVEDSLAYVGALGQVRGSYAWQMSQDGRTIAFLSLLGLTPDAPAFDPAAPLQENLYVWRDGVLTFVARGDVNRELEGGNLRLLSSNGRYLAFTENSTGPLSAATRVGVDLGSPTCPETGSVSPCEQVFVYDVDADELECASCRTDGLAPKGAAGDPGTVGKDMIRMGHRQVQTIANDGTAFFTTAEDLVAADVNGLNDVYAYRDGEHHLLSRAAQGMKARFLDATPDGKSVFFATNDPIAPTDNDKAIDVYMTREGAGFPYTPPVVDPVCTGGDCRGPLSPVEGLPLAGSVSFSGSGNVRPGGARLSVAGRRSIVGVAAKLRVKVPGKGRVTVSGSGVRTAKRSVSRAGTYTVRVALTAKARKALKKSKSAKKRVRVTFMPADGSASQRTLTLTYKAPANSKRKGR